MRRRHKHPHNHLRGQPQPPLAAGRHGHGVDHLLRRQNAPLRLDAERRRSNELEFPGQNPPPLLLEHGHHFRLRPISNNHIRPNAIPKSSSIPQNDVVEPIPPAPLPQPAEKYGRRRELRRGGAPPADIRPGALQSIQILRPANVSGARARRRRSPIPAAASESAERNRERASHRSEFHGGASGGDFVDYWRRRPHLE